jgi:alpha-D-ribose 1-methylphosphonate 5-phosphate C-P lyase
VETTTDARQATLVQTRHRIPETDLAEDTVLVFQVPIADPLRWYESRPSVARRMHAESDYAPIWLGLYEDHARLGASSITHSYPCQVGGRYIMTSSPIPRFDVPRLDQAPFLALFGAGREAAVYAVPPYTDVTPLTFDDRPFEVEAFDEPCTHCGSTASYLTQEAQDGCTVLACSDTAACAGRAATRRPGGDESVPAQPGPEREGARR